MEPASSCPLRVMEGLIKKAAQAVVFVKRQFSETSFLVGGICLFFWGLYTDYWGSGGVVHYGLWYYCGLMCEEYSEPFIYDWVFETKIIEETASVMYYAAVFIIVRRMYWNATFSVRHAVVTLYATGLDLLILSGGVVSMIGCYIFYANLCFPHSVSWSWIAVVLGSVSAVGGLAACRVKQYEAVIEHLKVLARRINNTEPPQNVVMNRG